MKKAAIPGVGLGLVITKSIVEAHSGRISFESELVAGTTFRVELPRPEHTGIASTTGTTPISFQ